jgi:hypothetical protein
MQCVTSVVIRAALRWPLLQLWLCALLLVQQPSLLVRSGQWLKATATATADAQRSSSGQIPEEEEEKIAGLSAESRFALRVRALRLREAPSVPVRPARREESSPAPRSCDIAQAHWRAALILPLRLSEGPPQRA